jgi:hypothetical protein
LAVVDEPVELCVTRLRYAQIHGFWRLVVKVDDMAEPLGQSEPFRHFVASEFGKDHLSLRVNQLSHPLILRTFGLA